MVDVLAAMYLLCTMSLTDPEVSGTDVSNMFPKEAIVQQEPAGKKEQPAIVDYKEELKKLGYLKKAFKDEKLNLRMAVIHFQADNNISLSGSWDEQSLAALKKRLTDGTVACGDTVESPPAKGKWIAVNKTKRILTLYEGITVLKKYPIAVGNPSSLTPSGKYSIACKIVNPAWGGGGYAEPVEGGAPNNPLGKRWLGLSLKGGSEYGIHGNTNVYSIGTYASHGCIRMDNTDVGELFEIVSVKNPVWLGSETELEKWGVKQPVNVN